MQMEATYKTMNGSVQTYMFDLDKSYTYLRAAGNFSSKAFIGVGDTDKLTSEKRVVYNGY